MLTGAFFLLISMVLVSSSPIYINLNQARDFKSPKGFCPLPNEMGPGNKAPKDMLCIGRLSDVVRSLSVWKSVLLPTVLDIESILTILKTETFHKQFRDLFPTTLHFGFEIQNLRNYFCMSSK